ncbi:uncharacterized protein METZ01_LOCUS79950 [marine metagenome]|uniref:Uncharacterized protein n=1 Tax=marine metagenome TaxID=408172 RepID=A0A381UFV8_9ZZZZ
MNNNTNFSHFPRKASCNYTCITIGKTFKNNGLRLNNHYASVFIHKNKANKFEGVLLSLVK